MHVQQLFAANKQKGADQITLTVWTNCKARNSADLGVLYADMQSICKLCAAVAARSYQLQLLLK